MKQRLMFVGGNWVPVDSGRTFAVRNPANGEIVGEVPDAATIDTRLAIDAAEDAFAEWAGMSVANRAKILHLAATEIDMRRDEIATMITREEGKPTKDALNEVAAATSYLTWYAEEGRRAYGHWIPDPLPDRRLLTIKQPVGIVGAIIPWNVPASMVTRKAAPALAAGCTVVLKPSEQTPITALLIAECFEAAGLPPGVFNVVTTSAPGIVGEALLTDVRVRKISFTGSTHVGKSLMRGAADQVKRMSMELGGNAAVIVCEDADTDVAVNTICALKFRNAGQACISANRIFVHRSKYEEVANRLAIYADSLKVGNGLKAGVQMGPVSGVAGLRKVLTLVEDAVALGASPIAGGKRLVGGEFEHGHFMAPTVLIDVPAQARLVQEEIFGPVAAIFPFDNENEVLQAANSTQYGLAAYLFTENISHAIRMAERLAVGMVGINDQRISTVEAPFGGIKNSGMGREGGAEGLDEYLDKKLLAIGIKV